MPTDPHHALMNHSNNPVPQEAIPYIQEVIVMMIESVFSRFDLTDTPGFSFYEDFVKEHEDELRSAFMKAEDILTSEIEAILEPHATSYLKQMSDLCDHAEWESETTDP